MSTTNPHDLNAEQAVLGAIVHDPQRAMPAVQSVLAPDDFFHGRHAALYEIMLSVWKQHRALDDVLLLTAIRDRGQDKATENGYLLELIETVPSAAMIEHHAGIVAGKARSRRALDALERAAMRLRDGGDAGDVLADLHHESSGERGRSAFQFFNAAEFDALDLKRDYHVPGILAAGPVPSILAGSFKTLKTSVGMDLLLSLATGSMFLNHYPVTKPVNVAIMSGESGGYALQSLARRILIGRGWSMASVGDRFRICPAVLNLANPGDLAEAERFIAEHDIRVFAIDPAYLAMRGLRNDDAGSLFAMASMLEPLARLGERTGCTPIIVHHNSRGATRANPGEPAELADIAWSGFAEWAGQWMLLSRRERYDPDSDGEHLLWMTAGGRDGHSTLVGVNVWEGRHDDPRGRRWQVEVEQASRTRAAAVEAEQDRKEQQREARKRAQLEADTTAIVEVMKNLPNGDTKTSIRERAGLSGGRFNPALASLLHDDRVVEVEITKPNGQTYAGFKLHPDAPGRTGTNNELSGCPDARHQHPDDSPIGGESGCVVCGGESPGGEQGQLLAGGCPGEGEVMP